MSNLAIKIAEWVWNTSQLDKEEESYCGRMFDDAVRQIDLIIEDNKEIQPTEECG